jgi:DNA-binding transcriptional regulator of glucitol operon
VRRYRFAGRPGWVFGHVLVLAAVITMILLGRWQLIVSDEKHFSLQNFGYAIQWWLFSLFAVFFWGRILRDQATRDNPPTPAETDAEEHEPIQYRRYVMPTTPPPSNDPVLAEYNDYLAKLAEQDENKR